MAGRTDGLIKSFRAGAAIGPRTYVKFGATDQDVVPAAAAGDKIIGVSLELPADVGEPIDIALGGIPEVKFGGNVTRGDILTSDANGAAVTAAPGAGVVNRTGGVAMCSGVAGDIGATLFVPGQIKG